MLLLYFRYGGGYDLASRRKNATRESTATLKAWLSEHKKNPYPTKGEKIMLAIITKMTLTQVSKWYKYIRVFMCTDIITIYDSDQYIYGYYKICILG